MFKNILVLAAVLVSFNLTSILAQAAETPSDRIKCEVVKVINAESGFQVGNEIQFTTELDQVFMDDYSANCEIIASEIDQANQETVQCEDSDLMTFLQNRSVLVIEDVAVLTCQ